MGSFVERQGDIYKIFVPSMDDKLSLQGYISTLQCICTGSCAAVNQGIVPYGYQCSKVPWQEVRGVSFSTSQYY